MKGKILVVDDEDVGGHLALIIAASCAMERAKG